MIGRSVSPVDPRAYSFCSVGAVAHVSKSKSGLSADHEAYEYLAKGMGLIGFCCIPIYNDQRATHKDILRGFDRAIALAEEDADPIPASPPLTVDDILAAEVSTPELALS